MTDNPAPVRAHNGAPAILVVGAAFAVGMGIAIMAALLVARRSTRAASPQK